MINCCTLDIHGTERCYQNTSAIISLPVKRDFSLSDLNIEHISTISGPLLEAVLLRYVKLLTPSDMNITQKKGPSFVSLAHRFVSAS